MKLEQTTSTVVDGVEVFPIPGFSGRFHISRCGRVWRSEYWSTRVWPDGERPRKLSAKWLSPATHGDRYLKIRLATPDKKTTYLYVHRLLALVFLGALPTDEIDHRDGDPLNNGLANLRRTSRFGNSQNSRLPKNNTSGFKGVRAKGSRWYAVIWHLGRNHYLGSFSKPEIAALAYDQAAQEKFGEFARLNFS